MINQYGNDCEFALYVRGVIARIESQLEEAIGWFEKARETSANCHIYDIELGRVSLLLGRQTNAVDYLERAIKADPNDAVRVQSFYYSTEVLRLSQNAANMICESSSSLFQWLLMKKT